MALICVEGFCSKHANLSVRNGNYERNYIFLHFFGVIVVVEMICNQRLHNAINICFIIFVKSELFHIFRSGLTQCYMIIVNLTIYFQNILAKTSFVIFDNLFHRCTAYTNIEKWVKNKHDKNWLEYDICYGKIYLTKIVLLSMYSYTKTLVDRVLIVSLQ